MEYERKELLMARSERVKGIDFHPTEPWILTTLYSGHVNIWSFESKAIVKSFELTDVPVRAGRFIARKNWIVCGSDDFQIRVYNFNTSEKITSFEAHPDYIRAIVVHPSQPFVLTASDDMTIKLWDWDRSWKCVKTYEGHSHYVMGLAINPKDSNTFASACLDRTVKVWNLGSERPNYTIEAHETKGVNHVDYYPHADNPYLLTTSDDQTVKIWDYTSKSLVHTLGDHGEGHTSNVSFACYHPVLPLIISGSEDGTVKLWSSITFKLLDTIRYGLERAWCVSYQREEQGIAMGFDDGAVVVKIGRDDPAVSMQQQGWFAWYYKTDLHIARLRSGVPEEDGSPTATDTVKTEDFNGFYPQLIAHSRRGQYFAVCGSGEYAVYSTRGGGGKESMKTVCRGTGGDFVWGVNTKTNNFAICIRSDKGLSDTVKIMTNQLQTTNDLGQSTASSKSNPPGEKILALEEDRVEGLAGGVLLGVRGRNNIYMHDWDTGSLVKIISATPKHVYWSESGELVAMACEDTCYILRFSLETYRNNLKAGLVDDEGVQDSLVNVSEIEETVRSGLWVGDCFVYTSSTNRLSYLVGDRTYLVAPFDKPMYLLGYLQNKERVYLADKDVNIVSYALSLQIVEYQTLVLRGDLETAESVLEGITSDDDKTKIARFLEGQGYKDMALEITKDREHRFDLALGLNNLNIALEIARETDLEPRWKIVGDSAIAAWDLALAEECFTKAKDLGSLLLLYSAASNLEGLKDLVGKAEDQAAHNVSFACMWYLGDINGCLKLLLRTNRVAEAVFLSRTYKPSHCREIVKEWKSGLEKSGKSKISRMIAVPPAQGEADEDDFFPDWEESLRLEKENEEQSFQPPSDHPIEQAGTEEITQGDAPDDSDQVEATE